MRTEAECANHMQAFLAGTIRTMEDRFEDLSIEDQKDTINMASVAVDAIAYLEHCGLPLRTAEECAETLKKVLWSAYNGAKKYGNNLAAKEQRGVAAMFDGIMDAIEHLERIGQKQTRPPLQ